MTINSALGISDERSQELSDNIVESYRTSKDLLNVFRTIQSHARNENELMLSFFALGNLHNETITANEIMLSQLN